MADYPFDQAWQHESERLTALEQGLDPGTIRHLEALGVGPGWRCWEVGAGAGSIAAWLCQRVGDEGHVMATDLEMTFLERLSYPNLALLRHDIVADDLPEGGPFDLVHARWVLEWIPDRRKALARMVSALKPGGWLLVEASDFVTLFHACQSDIVRKVLTAFVVAARRALGPSARTDHSQYGRRLFDDLSAQGLLDVEALGRVEMMRGGGAHCTSLRLAIQKTAGFAIKSGAIMAEEVEEALARLNDPAFATMSAITMAVWGRRPPGGSEGAAQAGKEKAAR
jgi:SAM-dependent methyltransferase